MRTILARSCARRSTRPPQDDITSWARDLVARPQRYGADERTRAIVADLLVQTGAR